MELSVRIKLSASYPVPVSTPLKEVWTYVKIACVMGENVMKQRKAAESEGMAIRVRVWKMSLVWRLSRDVAADDEG